MKKCNRGLATTPFIPYNKDSIKGVLMAVYVGPDHDTSMVNSEVVMMTRRELDTPEYDIIENDYDDDFDVI